MNPIMYDTLPPKPTSHMKLFKVPLDPNRHISHRITPSFIADSKPLLTRCDVGVPIEDLIVNYNEY